VVVTRTKDYSRELVDAVWRQRRSAGEPHLNPGANGPADVGHSGRIGRGPAEAGHCVRVWQQSAVKTRLQRRSVVGDHEVTFSQKVEEAGARCVRDTSATVDDEQPGAGRALHGSICRNH
jgi:hypothetical protein